MCALLDYWWTPLGHWLRNVGVATSGPTVLISVTVGTLVVTGGPLVDSIRGYCWLTSGYCWLTSGYCWLTSGRNVKYRRTIVCQSFNFPVRSGADRDDNSADRDDNSADRCDNGADRGDNGADRGDNGTDRGDNGADR